MKATEVDELFVQAMEEFRKPENKEVGLIEGCSQSVVLFAEKMLGFKLYAWQVYFLTRIQRALEGGYWTKEFACMTSRQIGKSTAVAIFCVWCAVFNKYPGKGNIYGNTVIGVVSASDAQAKKLLEEMKKMIRIGDRQMLTYKNADGTDKFPAVKKPDGRVVGFFSFLLDDSERNNMATITFKAWDEKKHGPIILAGSKIGSVIKSYPPTAVVLGETFSLEIIDEAGMAERIDDTFFNEYVYPTGNARDAVRIRISTPWQSSGFFYKMMDPEDMFGESSVERFVFTIEAIRLENPEYYEKVMKDIEKKRRDGLLDEVNRAYYCRFVKGEQSYFDPDAVMKAFTSEYSMVENYGGPCDIGIDFGGQVNSRTVVTISTCNESGKVHRAYPVGQDLGLLDDIEELMGRFNIQRVIPDDCPAGDYLIRLMKEKGWTVQPMNFRSEKVKKYGAFRASLNRGEMESYQDDELKVEMLSLQFEHGKVNSVIHHAPGERDDLIDSWVMSCYFYVVEEGSFEFYDTDDGNDEPPSAPVRKESWWRVKR